MLKNQNSIDIVQAVILNTLMESEIDFYATGSRFFGGYVSQSDFDFFTDVTQVTADFLHSIGFVRDYETNYNSVEVACVYSHEAANIHVQLVRDVEAKNIVQEILKEEKAFLGITKIEQRKIWNLGFKFYYRYNKPSGYLVDPDDPYTTITSSQLAEVYEFLDKGQKINAIKLMREITGLGLKEAKLAVERVQEELEEKNRQESLSPTQEELEGKKDSVFKNQLL